MMKAENKSLWKNSIDHGFPSCDGLYLVRQGTKVFVAQYDKYTEDSVASLVSAEYEDLYEGDNFDYVPISAIK